MLMFAWSALTQYHEILDAGLYTTGLHIPTNNIVDEICRRRHTATSLVDVIILCVLYKLGCHRLDGAILQVR